MATEERILETCSERSPKPWSCAALELRGSNLF